MGLHKIRNQTTNYYLLQTQAKLKREHETNMINTYYDLSETFDKTKDIKLLDEIEKVKNEIEKLNNTRTEGNIIRSKAKTIIDQQNASFYVNREKKNYKTSHITTLERINGDTISEPSEVLTEMNFYPMSRN